MENILLILGICLVIMGYGIYLILYLLYGNKKEKKSGYDGSFDMLNDDAVTKIVLGKNLIFSTYNRERNSIRLANRTYNGQDSFSVAVGSVLAGISLVDVKRGIFAVIDKAFKNFRIISLSGLLSIVIGNLIFTSGDAVIGILALIAILGYQFLVFQIINNGVIEAKKKTRDKDVLRVLEFIIYSQFFMIGGTVVQMVRLFILMIM